MANNYTKLYSVRDNLKINLNTMHKETAKKLFLKTHNLFKQGESKSEIARKLHIERETVISWLKTKDYQDGRGWPGGKYRTHTDQEKERILEIRKRIIQQKRYYWGKDIVQKEYRKLYPDDPAPTFWFIEELIRHHHLQVPKPKKRKKDITRYLHYPYNLIKKLGKVHESIDFIGRKYIDNVSDPLHFLARYYQKPVGLYLASRTMNEKRQEIERILDQDWQKIPLPDVVILDNALSMYGPAKAKCFIGLFIQKLFQYQVIPVFNPPRSPWANGGIEGSNSIFGKKFWKPQRFQNTKEVDEKLDQFNKENIERSNLNYLSQKNYQKGFKESIYFVRFAKIDSFQEKYPSIEILNDKVYLPETFTYQYVFAKLDINKEYLIVYVERDTNPQIIHEQKFPVKFTKPKLSDSIYSDFHPTTITQPTSIFN